MTKGSREERIEAYRAESRKADEHAAIGETSEALNIVKAQHERAREVGDEDYRLFFEAETLSYSEPDYARQIALLHEAFAWQAEQTLPGDHFLLRNMGVYLSSKGDQDGAIEWYDKALAVNPKDSDAMRDRGVSLFKKGKEDAAIEWYDKALAVNPKDYHAMRQRGVSLFTKGDENAAIEWYDKALAVNPKDCHAMRQRGVSLSKMGKPDAAIEWYDKALAVNPKDSDAMRDRGVSLFKKGKEDAAIEWFDRALAVNPKDYDAIRNRGVSLGKRGDLDESIEWLDKALAANPKDYHAMRERGVSLSNKGDEDGAIEWYDKALAENPKDSDAMRNRGVSLGKRGDLLESIEWFDKALGANPKDSAAHRNWAVSAYNAGREDESFEHMRKAVELAPQEHRDDFRFLCRALGRDPRKEWEQLFSNDRIATSSEATEPPTPVVASEQDPFVELREFIISIRDGYGDAADKFLKQMKENKDQEADFLEPESRMKSELSLMMVLRKWNSYTPAIPTAEDERSRGGGYFIWHNGKGTVIDPGYNFLENFHEAGCRICDIDSVVLTHAHNDHTIDFESLRTLLHQFNDKKKPEKQKKVDFYLSNGAFLKLGGLLDLHDWDFTNHVATLNPGGEFKLAGGIGLRVLTAYHDDLVARDQAVGLMLTVPTGEGDERRILFTSDTGLFPLEKDGKTLKPNTEGPEVWETYGPIDKIRPDVMVVHIGSVKDSEFKMAIEENPREICYPNHLGIIGTARIITKCRPRLAVVSEFGDEMRQFRCDLVRGLQEKVIEPVLKLRGVENIPCVVPGDLPFIYDIEQDNVLCVLSESWVSATEIDFARETRGDELSRSVYYFAKEKKDEFGVKAKEQILWFKCMRGMRRGLYFKNKA